MAINIALNFIDPPPEQNLINYTIRGGYKIKQIPWLKQILTGPYSRTRKKLPSRSHVERLCNIAVKPSLTLLETHGDDSPGHFTRQLSIYVNGILSE